MNKYMYEHGVLRLNPIHYLNWRKYTWKNDDVKIIVRKKQEIFSIIYAKKQKYYINFPHNLALLVYCSLINTFPLRVRLPQFSRSNWVKI